VRRIIAILIAVVLAACASVSVPHGSEEANSVSVELSGTPSTGYSWTWTADREGIVKEVYSGFTRDEENIRPGSGGLFVFTFEGEAEGSTELVFSYARPWEAGEAAETVRYAFTVDKTKRVTCQRLGE
jgi:predicted secreted protein